MMVSSPNAKPFSVILPQDIIIYRLLIMHTSFSPAYLSLSEEDFRQRVSQARDLLRECKVCPRECGVNRLEGELGSCGAGDSVIFNSAFSHRGEEPPLVGRSGSGTIFFSNCNLSCVYCQNYRISQFGEGTEISAGSLAREMIKLQRSGCHNINLVSPTHYAPQLLEAVLLARNEGLKIPLVYNTGGYDSLRMLSFLDGIVDIYARYEIFQK